MIRVLLVDDEADLTALLANQLTRGGFEVRCADSLTAAKELVSDIPFDVLVTDLSLPDGDGIDVARLMRIPLRVAVTGSAAEADARRLRAEGFSDVLVKPVSYDRLVEAIKKATGT